MGAPGHAPGSARPEPPGLWSALESGVGELEVVLARGGQGVALITTVVALYVAVMVTRRTGMILSVVSIASLLFYTAAHALLVRDVGRRALRIVIPLVEIGVPSSALYILALTEGPEYALGSWVPPQLFSVFIAASILRLHPMIPLLMGTLSAAAYGAIWWAVIAGQVDSSFLLYRPEMQITRMISLVLTGGVCAAGVRSLRGAIGLANTRLRQQELFGKYRLGERIASGGMGSVHEALYCPEGGFERKVAIKLIHPHLATDPGFVDRFRREAELCSQLLHPNIVAALDFGRIHDTYFLAMEFVDGRPLSALLRERRRMGRPLAPRAVAWIGLQLAEALHHAHAVATDSHGNLLQVVHRDLSPSNVLIGRSGRIRMADFGVARALGAATHLETKTLVGKASYVAPEQLHEQTVDPRADLWSLGVVLWEALTGDRLFHREHEGATLLAVVTDDVPSVSSVRDGLDPEWDAFLDAALQRDPDQRIPSAAVMRARLDVLVRLEGPPLTSEIAELLLDEAELPDLELDDPSDVVLHGLDDALPTSAAKE